MLVFVNQSRGKCINYSIYLVFGHNEKHMGLSIKKQVHTQYTIFSSTSWPCRSPKKCTTEERDYLSQKHNDQRTHEPMVRTGKNLKLILWCLSLNREMLILYNRGQLLCSHVSCESNSYSMMQEPKATWYLILHQLPQFFPIFNLTLVSLKIK